MKPDLRDKDGARGSAAAVIVQRHPRRRPRPLPASPSSTLVWQVLDCLDLGVLTASDDLVCVELANTRARELVELGTGRWPPLPEWLRAAARRALAVGSTDGFGRAIRTTDAAGRTLFVRGRRLAGAEPRVALTVAAARVREADVIHLLCTVHSLNRREAAIATRIRDGLRNKEIADELTLTTGTVKWYVSRIFAALDVSSRSELVAFIDRLLAQE